MSNQASYQIDLPPTSNVVVFYNGIKALNFNGLCWLWQQVLSSNQTGIFQAEGCIDVKLGICSYREVIIVSYWQDEKGLINFFHSPLHRQMMKKMKQMIATDSEAISVFNETYRPIGSGKYFNEPQGLAKIYPPINKTAIT